ncbi:hypothetical protein ACLF3G_03455 [Falsiroseomonas sp. HC035]
MVKVVPLDDADRGGTMGFPAGRIPLPEDADRTVAAEIVALFTGVG